MLSEIELRKIYGREYVDRFEKEQDGFRVARLMDDISLSQTMDAIDFGCGSGMLLPLLAGRVRSYTGIDFSDEFIRAAKNKYSDSEYGKVEFVCDDIQRFCRSNSGKYNVAFALDFSEHVYDEQWLSLLQSMKNTLVKGGRLYVHTPNAEFFLEIMKERNFILKQFPEHIAVRSLEENTLLLEKAGFKVTYAQHIPHYNILKYIHPLAKLPYIGHYFNARLFIEASVAE